MACCPCITATSAFVFTVYSLFVWKHPSCQLWYKRVWQNKKFQMNNLNKSIYKHLYLPLLLRLAANHRVIHPIITLSLVIILKVCKTSLTLSERRDYVLYWKCSHTIKLQAKVGRPKCSIQHPPPLPIQTGFYKCLQISLSRWRKNFCAEEKRKHKTPWEIIWYSDEQHLCWEKPKYTQNVVFERQFHLFRD